MKFWKKRHRHTWKFIDMTDSPTAWYFNYQCTTCPEVSARSQNKGLEQITAEQGEKTRQELRRLSERHQP